MATRAREVVGNPIVRKFGRKYEVLTSDGTRTLGEHKTLAAANRQARAVYSHEDRARAPNPPTHWTDRTILESVRDGQRLTPEANARAYELGTAGAIDLRGTWKLTPAGEEFLGGMFPTVAAPAYTVEQREILRVGNPTPPSYAAAHWGLDPKKVSKLTIPDPRDNRAKGMRGLGELVSVTYMTKKGGDTAMVDYVHPFERTKPVLCYGSKDGRLYIAGGSYRVTSRGIVG